MRVHPLVYYVIVISFSLGWLSTSYLGQRIQLKFLSPIFNKETVSVLSMEGALPSEVTDQFLASENMRIDVTEFHNGSDFWKTFNSAGPFNVVLAPAELTTELVTENKIVSLQKKWISNFQNVSPDFLHLSTDPDNEYGVPLSWSLEKTRATSQSETNYHLGLVVASVVAGSHAKSAHKFINFLMNPEISKTMAIESRLGTTNRALDSQAWKEELKSSFIRRIPATLLSE